jgi:ABC-type sugar transport system substrate-binding protein
MKKRSGLLIITMLASLLSVAAAKPLSAQSAAKSMPKVGDIAPDFKLQYFDGKDDKEISLSQYRGKKNVVLAFYIFAFTGG